MVVVSSYHRAMKPGQTLKDQTLSTGKACRNGMLLAINLQGMLRGVEADRHSRGGHGTEAGQE